MEYRIGDILEPKPGVIMSTCVEDRHPRLLFYRAEQPTTCDTIVNRIKIISVGSLYVCQYIDTHGKIQTEELLYSQIYNYLVKCKRE